MHSELFKRDVKRKKRAFHVRNAVRGTADQPRLSCHKSNKYVTAQLIDDTSGKTLVYLSTHSAGFAKKGAGAKNCSVAKTLGEQFAKLAKDKGIERVVMDRGHRRYHGAIKAIADGAREQGLVF